MASQSEISRATTLQQLLYVSGNTVAGVLDTYRQQYASDPFGRRPMVIDEIKLLHQAIESYEKQVFKLDSEAVGAFLTPRPDTRALFENCHLVARHLQLQTKQQALPDDLDTIQEVQTLITNVKRLTTREETVASSPKLPEAPDPPRTRHEHPPSRSAYRSAHSHRATSSLETSRPQSTPDFGPQLHHIMQQNEDLRSRVRQLEASNQSKLEHINALHAAASTLNERFPAKYAPKAWALLEADLPRIVALLEATSRRFSQLEFGPLSPTLSQPMLSPSQPHDSQIHLEDNFDSDPQDTTSILRDLDLNRSPKAPTMSKPPLRRITTTSTRRTAKSPMSPRSSAKSKTLSYRDKRSSPSSSDRDNPTITGLPHFRPSSPSHSFSATSTAVSSSFSTSSIPAVTANSIGHSDPTIKSPISTRPGHKRNQSSKISIGTTSGSGGDYPQEQPNQQEQRSGRKEDKKEKRRSGRGFWSS